MVGVWPREAAQGVCQLAPLWRAAAQLHAGALGHGGRALNVYAYYRFRVSSRWYVLSLGVYSFLNVPHQSLLHVGLPLM